MLILRPLFAAVIVLLGTVAARTATADVPLFLEFVVNGYNTSTIGEFIQRDHRLLARPQELRDLGFLVPDNIPREPDGLISLSNIPGLMWRLDQSTQRLNVTAPDDLLMPTLIRPGQTLSRLPVESGTGATLNYNMLLTRANTDTDFNGLFDLRVFSPFGVASSDLLIFRGPAAATSEGDYQAVRLDSTYTYSDPASLMRYRAGDFITGGLSWTRPIRLGGAQASEDFSLRPDLVAMPLPSVSGTIAVPSSVDVLVNSIRVLSTEVKPGPFVVPQIPAVTGSSDISVAVTNSLGQQTIQSLTVYTGSDLLAQGLQSFSAEAGLVRHDYGLLSNAYERFAASATWRRGITDMFTAEAHAEAAGNIVMAGGGGVLNFFNLGLVNFGIAGSTGANGSGGLVSFGVSRLARPFSFSASATFAQRRFADVASHSSDPFPSRRLSASAGLSLGMFGSLGLAYNGIDRPSVPLPALRNPVTVDDVVFLSPAQHAHILSTSYSKQIGIVSFYANAFHDLSGRSGTGVLFGLSVPFGPRSSGGASLNLAPKDNFGQADYTQAAFQPGDFGFHAYAAEGQHQHEFGQAQYMGQWGTVTSGVDHVAGQFTEQAGAQGAVTFIAGSLFPSNPVNDAFAVVDTNGVPNIRVYRENREVGRTDSAGQIFVPDLRSYDVNHLSIAPEDVPADATLNSANRDVRISERSGVVLSVPIQFSRAAIAVLMDETGKPVAFGSAATLRSTGNTLTVGYDGELYILDLDPHNELDVQFPNGGRCVAEFDYKPVPGEIPTIRPVICRPVQ